MSTLIAPLASGDEDFPEVAAIDVWFSTRRKVWIVERVTFDGRTLGMVVTARTECEVLECCDLWRRAHPGAHLPPRDQIAAKTSVREGRRAA